METSDAELQLEMINGKVASPLSLYQPEDDITKLQMEAHKDLIHGDLILSRPFREFNNYSLIQRASLDQKDWLAWSPEPSTNPDESWMFTGTSNVTRNNILSMAAHLAQKVMFPGVMAVDDSQQLDKDASYVAEALLEYNFRRSGWEQTFLYAVISAMVNPVSYYKADYCKAYMSILEGTNSNYTRRTVLDDAMSGSQHYLLPTEEVLISNPYCFDINRQKVLIHRRRVSYSEAYGLFGNNPNWGHVKVGVMPMYNASDALFYNVRDPLQDNMVEICTYKYRGIDLEFDEVNRVYMGNPNVNYNPFKHRTNKNKPEYNIAKFGAEPIDAKRFWAYKSIAAKLSNDKELVDRMRQNAVDASTLSTFPTIFTMGAGKIDQSVMKPATVTDIDKDAKVQPVSVANPAAAWNAMKEAEQNVDDATNPSYFTLPSGSGGKKTALEIQILQQNAITNLAVLGSMVSAMIKDIGQIVLYDILRYETVAEISEVVNGVPQLLYKNYNIPRVKNGSNVTEKIMFTDAWAGVAMTPDEKRKASIGLIDKHGKDAYVWEVNPSIFIKLNFEVQVEPDELLGKDALSVAQMKQDIYDKAVTNPLFQNDPEKMGMLVRDFLFEPVLHGDASKYIPDSTKKVLNGIIPGMQGSSPQATGSVQNPAVLSTGNAPQQPSNAAQGVR